MVRDWERVIQSDKRKFNYGEIFQIKDNLIRFPEDGYIKRTKHENRLVVVCHHVKTNSDQRHWSVLIAPCSSQVDYQNPSDLKISPNEMNRIDRDTLIRLGMSQPVLKMDLVGPLGKLSDEESSLLSNLQLKLAGIKI